MWATARTQLSVTALPSLMNSRPQVITRAPIPILITSSLEESACCVPSVLDLDPNWKRHDCEQGLCLCGSQYCGGRAGGIQGGLVNNCLTITLTFYLWLSWACGNTHCDITGSWPSLAGRFLSMRVTSSSDTSESHLLGTHVNSGSCPRLPQACDVRTPFHICVAAVGSQVWRVFMRPSRSLSPWWELFNCISLESGSWEAEDGETKKWSWRGSRAPLVVSCPMGPWWRRRLRTVSWYRPCNCTIGSCTHVVGCSLQLNFTRAETLIYASHCTEHIVVASKKILLSMTIVLEWHSVVILYSW